MDVEQAHADAVDRCCQLEPSTHRTRNFRIGFERKRHDLAAGGRDAGCDADCIANVLCVRSCCEAQDLEAGGEDGGECRGILDFFYSQDVEAACRECG